MINQGLDYIPIKVNFFEDDKVEFIKLEYGINGCHIVIRLLCKIYSEGYFYHWGQTECMLFASKIGKNMTPEYVNEVVMKMVEIGFFDEKLFNDYGILTSEDIQKQFFFVAKNRTNITVQREYLLVSRNLLPRFTHFNDDLDNAEENVNNCENTSDFAERKGKERKDRKESKERKEMCGGDTPARTKDFLDFKRWIGDNAPWCAKNLELPTQSQYEALKQTWKIDDIYMVTRNLENKRNLRCNYTNLFVTLQNWLERDEANKRITRLPALNEYTFTPETKKPVLSPEEEKERSLRLFRERLERDAAKGSEEAKRMLKTMNN